MYSFVPKPAIQEVTEAIKSTRQKPDLVLLPKRKWRRLFKSLPAHTKAFYEHTSYAKVTARKNGRVYTSAGREVPHVQGIFVKGIPVVQREAYEELMAGHRSSRRVLAV